MARNKMGLFLAGLVGLLVLALAYVRFAPSRAEIWHVGPASVQAQALAGGAVRIVPGSAQTLAVLQDIILAEPHTKVLAGAVSDGMITFVTRSKLLGFPDYTTLQTTDKGLVVYGRLRFGKSDFGVNAARLDRWVAALPAVQIGTQAAR
ncbi:hypothetical protein NBRC116601_09090 [Cognatishimia sp. WU-CL00825]|uniref:DUF1499 domain-containing protein n=1 Tax=Cognatishimia sp. WU-CL00825 TaxID=3127658 RepID=UPI0031068B31